MDSTDHFEQCLRCMPLRSPSPATGDELLSRAARQLRSQRRWRLANAALITTACLLVMVNLIVGGIQTHQIAALSAPLSRPEPLRTRLVFLDNIEARSRFIIQNLSTGDSEAADLPAALQGPAEAPPRVREPVAVPPVSVEHLLERRRLMQELLEPLCEEAPPESRGEDPHSGGLHQWHRCGLHHDGSEGQDRSGGGAAPAQVKGM